MTITEFVQKHELHDEFQELKTDWDLIRTYISNQTLILNEQEQVDTNLFDISESGQTIEVFCITDERNSPGYGLYLVMN